MSRTSELRALTYREIVDEWMSLQDAEDAYGAISEALDMSDPQYNIEIDPDHAAVAVRALQVVLALLGHPAIFVPVDGVKP